MAKKKPAGLFPVGGRVRVKDGVNSPEYPDISFAGWTGTVQEVSGKPPNLSYVIEWSPDTLRQIPADYKARCERDNLFHLYALLPEDQLEAG
jgi:hypothetical protein